MVCETFSNADTIIHRLDGRVRLLAAAGLSVATALAGRFDALAIALAAGTCLAVAARLPAGPVLKRLRSLNLFMLVLWVALPLSMPGEVLLRLGPLAASREGLVRAAAITLKANANVLMLTALLSTLEPTALGAAMGRIRVPNKLIHLYFFTVRYIDVLHHEYERLRRAMRVRGFRPGVNRHTYRSVGYLVGMLLVKSFDRSERIVAAMKCRGFDGRFRAVDARPMAGRDVAFAAAAVAATALLGWLQWR
jgi:cobalt/nickel transport system permease protein